MGIQTMGSQSNGQQQSHLQPSGLLTRQNSWYSLTLDEVENQLGGLGKPLGSMNFDELLKNVWSADVNQLIGMDIESVSPASSLQKQASLTLARGLSGKTVDEVWKEIRQGEKKRFGEEMKGEDGEQLLREITLEDFLVKAGLFADSSIGPPAGFDAMSQSYPQQQQIGLLSSPSFGSLSDTTTPGQKRDAPDAYEKNLERRLRRKIKNRESAARSRVRKQAYHNELVSKVSHLEEENVKLKKEKLIYMYVAKAHRTSLCIWLVCFLEQARNFFSSDFVGC